MANKSLFQPATARQRYLKVLLRGFSGVGKTRAALGFPGPVAVIDLENSTGQYEGFDYVATRDIRALDAAVAELARGGTPYQTVVIDSLTVVWQLLQQAGQTIVDNRSRDGGNSLETGQALTEREWGIIKRWYAAFLTRLINLPMHVVLVSRETDLYDKSVKGQLNKIGTKADVEKNTVYNVELELILTTDRSGPTPKYQAVVEKTRLDALPLGMVLSGYGRTPTDGLYARFLAPVAATLSANVAAPPLMVESAVAGSNAAALEPTAGPPPLEEYYQRIGVHLTRLQIEGPGVGNLLGALTDGKYTDLEKITDRALLKQIGVRLAAMKTDDDLQRFWLAQDGPTRTWEPPTPTLPAMADSETGGAP